METIGNIFWRIGCAVSFFKAKYSLGYLSYLNDPKHRERVNGFNVTWY